MSPRAGPCGAFVGVTADRMAKPAFKHDDQHDPAVEPGPIGGKNARRRASRPLPAKKAGQP
jgi:hypothetical protein